MKSSYKKITANFFWHGRELSIYEFACLKSFIRNGFNVVVYSFKKIKLPKKVISKNANLILKKSEIKKFVHGGKKGCLAAYSDKFRILLQKENLGWWFDLDILCLRNIKNFEKLEKHKKILIGYETEHKVNNAVLKINRNEITNELLNKIKEQGYKFEWGKIGPTLFNNYLHNNNLETEILENYYFYPINYKNIEIFFNPKKTSVALKLTKKSYTIHLYNQIINRIGIPKNIMPPKGSYLYNKMIEICPEYKKLQSLPMETFDKLLNKKNGFKDNLFDLIPSFLRAFSRY